MEANFEIYCLIQLSHPIISFYIPSEVHIVRKTFKAFQGPEIQSNHQSSRTYHTALKTH